MPNIFLGYGYVWPKCECRKEAWELSEATRKAEEEQAKIDRFFGVFTLPERFKDRRIETFRPDAGSKEAYETTKRYIETIDTRIADGSGMQIVGKAGNGKTHLAASVYHAARERKITAVFGAVPDILAKLQATYRDDSKHSEWEFIGPLLNCQLLILDDLGKEKASEWTQATLFRIINPRYEAQKSTIVTSNYDPDTLANRIGEALVDRLDSMCAYLEITSPSRRYKEAPKW